MIVLAVMSNVWMYFLKKGEEILTQVSSASTDSQPVGGEDREVRLLSLWNIMLV